MNRLRSYRLPLSYYYSYLTAIRIRWNRGDGRRLPRSRRKNVVSGAFLVLVALLTHNASAWDFLWTNYGDTHETRFGYKIAGVGDQNGDGYDDVMVSSERYRLLELFFGGNPMDTLPDWRLIARSFIVLDDMNNDGILDYSFILPSDPRPRVFWGGQFDTNACISFPSLNGHMLHAAGDVNGDFCNDLWLSSSNESPGIRRGELRLYLGSENELDTIPDWQIRGEIDGENLGIDSGFDFDFNGDGYSDFIIHRSVRGDDGQSYGIDAFYFGRRDIENLEPAYVWDWREDSRWIQDTLWFSGNITPVKDMNNDGKDELLLYVSDSVTVEWENGPPVYAYYNAVMYGRNEFNSCIIDGPLYPRGALTSIGDVNDDGYNDLLMTGPGERWIALYLGGRWITGQPALVITEDDRQYLPYFEARIGLERAWCGDVDGDGLDDVMFSQYGSGAYTSMGFVCIIAGSDSWHTGVKENSTAILPPRTFSIAAISPNPFNSSVTIRYQLPSDELLRIAVFDLSGREVAVLWNSKRTAGYYNAVWQADGQASGVYLCRMEAEGFMKTVKLSLIK